MKIKDIAVKKEKDLEKFISDQKGKLLKLQFDIASKESNKVGDVKKIKKDIAKALTVKRQRELVKEEAADQAS